MDAPAREAAWWWCPHACCLGLDGAVVGVVRWAAAAVDAAFTGDTRSTVGASGLCGRAGAVPAPPATEDLCAMTWCAAGGGSVAWLADAFRPAGDACATANPRRTEDSCGCAGMAAVSWCVGCSCGLRMVESM